MASGGVCGCLASVLETGGWCPSVATNCCHVCPKLCSAFSCLPQFFDVISMFDPVCFFVLLQCGLPVHTAR